MHDMLLLGGCWQVTLRPPKQPMALNHREREKDLCCFRPLSSSSLSNEGLPEVRREVLLRLPNMAATE